MSEQQELKQYIGTKMVKACPMSREVAENYLGRDVGGTETGAGYLVEYEGGYRSWSPEGVFEKSYRRTDGLTFGLAHEAAATGLIVARKGWNRKGLSVRYHMPDFRSEMDRPYMYLTNEEGATIPWVPSQGDLWEEDWFIVE